MKVAVIGSRGFDDPFLLASTPSIRLFEDLLLRQINQELYL